MSHEETRSSGFTAFTSLVTTLQSVTPLRVASGPSGRRKREGNKTPADYREDIVYQLQNCYKVTGDGHWVWTGSCDPGKGGRVLRWHKDSGFSNYRAAPCSYELRNGPVPTGYLVKVLCGRANCIHPDHLDIFTKSQVAQKARIAMGKKR